MHLCDAKPPTVIVIGREWHVLHDGAGDGMAEQSRHGGSDHLCRDTVVVKFGFATVLAAMSSLPDRGALRGVPPLDACVPVDAGVYRLGDDGQRVVELGSVLIGRWPVATCHVRAFVEATARPASEALRRRLDAEQLADHPAAEVTFADVVDFCAWAAGELDRPVRLPRGDEWEAAARGRDGRAWPWGEVFDPERCNSVESGWGWTVPVRAQSKGAAAGGAEQLSGNVWEWVGDPADEDGWRTVRGGSYLDTAWGVRCARSLPADPHRATPTTGFRIAIEEPAAP